MKFSVSNDIKKNSFLRNILILLLISLGLFVASYSYFHIHSSGYFPSDLKNSVLGNEELFMEPTNFMVLLEEIHIAIFAYIVTAVILLMVLVQIKSLEKYFFSISLIIMLSILIDTISKPLILLWEPFIYVKTIAFTVSNLSLLLLTIITILFLSNIAFKGKFKR